MIEPIGANSRDGGEVYRLLCMIHSMAGKLANSDRKDFWLARTNSDPVYGPIITVWTNGIVEIEASTWCNSTVPYHEYFMRPVRQPTEGSDNDC